jgi:integrase
MSVRKRTWTSPTGEKKFAWQADYVDQAGKRHRETFPTKGAAEAFLVKAGSELLAGVHTPSSTSKTIAETGRLWLDQCESDGLERATIGAYRQHLELHIVPFIGGVKLSAFTAPMVSQFQKQLRDAGRSAAMGRKARIALGALLNYGTVHGLVAQNVVYSLGRNKKPAGSRTQACLEVGVDIPTPDEIRAIHARLSPGDRYRALLTTAFFTGLRASELRGLRWADVDLKRGELQVRQRADRFNRIGPPKSKAGARSVPLMPMVVSVLREHKLATPANELDLVFPNGRGHIDHLNTIVAGWRAAQVAAGVVAKGEAKYSGLHSIRHFFASWCINRKADGGLELPAKTVQVRCGHATIGITLDVYGHLFPSSDHGQEMVEAQNAWQR